MRLRKKPRFGTIEKTTKTNIEMVEKKRSEQNRKGKKKNVY